MFVDFREERRENHQCERETLIGCLPYVPQPEIKPATQASALTGNQTPRLSVYRTTLQPTEPHWPGLSLLYIPLSIKDQLNYGFSLIFSYLINHLDALSFSEIMQSHPLSILLSQHMEKQECRKVPQIKKISKCLYN